MTTPLPLAIEVNSLRRVYQSAQQEVVALKDVTLQVPVGRFIAVKGKSGSGKTTLLNCLGGLDQPTAGTIHILGEAIHDFSEDDLTSWRQKEIGFVFQSFGLLPTLSSYENVELMLRIAGMPRSERRARAREVLTLVGLDQWMDHRPYEMSGGQQQRLAVARAIANRPKLVLADEATGGLDTATSETILSLMQKIVREEGVTILLATHDSLVDDFVDEVLHLSDGRIVERDVKRPETETQPPFEGTPASEAGRGRVTVTKQAPSPKKRSTNAALTSEDWLWAGLMTLIALLFYGRTLAPDLLYSDSGEFQVLAQTLGLAHPTGYPVYILLTKLLTYIPIGTLAWRVNLFSALAAAATISGIYLLCRQVTANRLAAILASLALLISYSMWSQAIIAEVYTVGTLFWVVITTLLWRWSEAPGQRVLLLAVAAGLTALCLGIHIFTVLIAPAAIVFVIMVLRGRGLDLRRPLAFAAAGTAVGLILFLGAFFIIDNVNSVTSFNAVTMIPSQEAFGLSSADFRTFWQRLFLSLTAPQWQDAMFPGGPIYLIQQIGIFIARFLGLEFSILFGIGFLWGGRLLWRQDRIKASFLLIALAVNLFVILNYNPGDKHIFFLPSYLAMTIAASLGLDRILTWFTSRFRLSANIATIVFVILVGQHLWLFRGAALAQGTASFVSETYPYPKDDLSEPRQVATAWVENTPENALLVLEWRALYTTYYIAQVEMDRSDIEILEALPHGTDGVLPNTLVDMVAEALASDRPVFSQNRYAPLPAEFQLTWDPDVNLFRVKSR